MNRVVVVIPARYKSSRFPGKPLVQLLGKSMITRVAEICSYAVGKENVFIATDDSRIMEEVERFDFQAIQTSELCATGTDRVAEAAELIDADIYINVQGDEPLVEPADILRIIEAKKNYPNHVINGYSLIYNTESISSINIPKLVTNELNELIYISRLPIPGSKELASTKVEYKKQVCIYAFSKAELVSYKQFGRKSDVEKIEDIEILRFFELNKKVKMIQIEEKSHAVDEPGDVKIVESLLKKKYESD